MEQKVHPEDYRFLTKMAGMQNALIASAADPVIIPRKDEGTNSVGMLYYECNEESAERVIKDRLAMHKEAIRTHMGVHSTCLANYIAMDSALLGFGNRRDEFADAVVESWENMKNYAEVVREHQKLKSWFLNYPKAPSGLYFGIQGTGKSSVSPFNGQRTYDGMQRELKWIEDHVVSFAGRKDELPIVAFGEREKKYFTAGFYDLLFQKTLLATYELLGRLKVVS